MNENPFARSLRRVEPSRITHALDVNELHGPSVDQALGVAGPNGEDLGVVDRWETGELVPTPPQLLRLAILTGFSVGWFFREPLGGADAIVCIRGGKDRGCHFVTTKKEDHPTLF